MNTAATARRERRRENGQLHSCLFESRVIDKDDTPARGDPHLVNQKARYSADTIRRRRECHCGNRFTTRESIGEEVLTEQEQNLHKRQLLGIIQELELRTAGLKAKVEKL